MNTSIVEEVYFKNGNESVEKKWDVIFLSHRIKRDKCCF